jgi:hypothetical protein
VEYAKDECGQPYALLAAILSGFHGIQGSLKGMAAARLQPLFCSQAFAEVYKCCGGKLGWDRPNPHVLAQLLVEAGATGMVALPPDLFVPQNPFI